MPTSTDLLAFHVDEHCRRLLCFMMVWSVQSPGKWLLLIVGAGLGWSGVGGTTFLDAAQTVLMLEVGPIMLILLCCLKMCLDRAGSATGPINRAIRRKPHQGVTSPMACGRFDGGTGAIKAAAAQWGHPADFAAWQALGLNDWGWADENPGFVAWRPIMTRPALTMKAMAPFQSHATDRPNPPSEAHPPCQHGLLRASRQGADQYEDGRTLVKSALPRGAQL
jgi:hypothetical protein